MNNKLISCILLPMFIAGCDSDFGNSYFCEGTRYGNDESSTLYFQTSVKINNDGMCLYHRGTDFCTSYGSITEGFQDKSEWDKNLIHSEKYLSSNDGDNYKFKVFDKIELRKDIKVDARLIGDSWHFTFKGKELKPVLPGKFANAESIIIYKIAAIENVEYAFARGDFVSQKSTQTSNSDKYGVDYLFQKEQVIFNYGSEKYNELKSKLNGTFLHNIYTFNKANLSLVDEYINPSFVNDRIYHYQCQIWKKQKWYEFP